MGEKVFQFSALVSGTKKGKGTWGIFIGFLFFLFFFLDLVIQFFWGFVFN